MTKKIQKIDTKANKTAQKLPATSSRATVQALFESQSNELEKALSGQMSTDRFIRAAMTAYSAGSAYFKQGDPVSLLGACIQAAQLGLSVDPVLGEAWLIPRRHGDRGVFINFQIGYKGLIKLARRNENFLSVHAELVHEGDFFEYNLGSEPQITHRKQMKAESRPEVIASYAVVRYKTGSSMVHVSPMWEIMEARDRSDSYRAGRGPWVDHFNSMCKVVPLRAILKLESVEPAVIRQMNIEDMQEAGKVVQVGFDGEVSVLDGDDPKELGEVSSVDDIKEQFGKGVE